jgi:hypothetical protein
MKIISSKLHGILDYVLAIFIFTSPALFSMKGNLCIFTYSLAAIYFLLTFFTNFETGIIKIISFPLHGLVEFFGALALTMYSFWLNRNGNYVGFHYYLYLSIAIIFIFLMTDYKRKL